MRKVPLEQLTPDMRLGRTVFRGMNVLINSGSTNLDHYARRLRKLGVAYLYIEDAACEGIDFDDLVTERTRLCCKRTLDKSFKQMRSRFSVDVKALNHLVESIMDEVLCRSKMLVSLNEIGSIGDNTLDHSVNTTIYAICLSRQLGYKRARIMDIAQGTLLHDVGKTLLDSRILFKPGKLMPEEFEHIKQHPQLGYDILAKNSQITEACKQICLYHHERLDGSGYPYGLAGDAVPESARIAAIVDVYEALTVDRCYHKAVTPQRAIEILTQDSLSKFDVQFASMFMRNVAVYPNGTPVLLSTGQYAVVKEQNQSLPLRPVVRVVVTEHGKCLPREEINLAATLNVTILESDVLLPI